MLVLPKTPLVASSLTGLVLVGLGLVGVVGAGPGLPVLLLGTLLLTLPSEPTERAWRAVADRTAALVAIGVATLGLLGLGVVSLVAGSGSGRLVGLGLVAGAAVVAWWVWWFRTEAPTASTQRQPETPAFPVADERASAGLVRSGS